jgi:hypothetical protein
MQLRRRRLQYAVSDYIELVFKVSTAFEAQVQTTITDIG